MPRENYFILLNLQFDPPENNKDKINAAIAAAQQQWSKDMDNPFKKDAARKHLEMLADIRVVMNDDGQRASEAKQAKKIREAKLTELDNKLVLYHASTDELSDKQIKALLKTYGSYGISETLIRKRFKAGEEQEKEQIGEVISKDMANNIRNKFNQMGTPEATLYTFLGLSDSSSPDQLVTEADALRKRLLTKGSNSATDAASQALAGLAKEIFKNQAEKKKYDNYLRVTRYVKLNTQINDVARMNKRTINPKAKEALIDFALKTYPGEGLTLSKVSAYIDTYCEYMGYVVAENKIICGQCHTENPAGATVCQKCGKPLFIVCPKCGMSIPDNSAKRCPKCDFDLTRIDSLKKIVEEAKKAIISRQYDKASNLISQVKVDWANNPDLPAMEKQIADFQSGFDATYGEIQKAVREKNFYQARQLISKAQNEGYQIDAGMVREVSQVIAKTEQTIASVHSMNRDDAFKTLMGLFSTIHDSQEVKNQLSNFPPEPAGRIVLQQSGNNVSVSWASSPSAGEVEYVLMRREGVAPDAGGQGEIYRGKDVHYSDSGLKKGVLYYYGVIAVRAGIKSLVTVTGKPVVSVDTVSQLRASGGDQKISLAWTAPGNATEIRVGCAEGMEAPSSDSEYRLIPCNRFDGITINGLKNNSRYWFRVTACYSIGGKMLESEPVNTSAVPVKPALPLKNFKVVMKEERFEAAWSPSEWDVVLFWSENKPDYSVGPIYDLKSLLGKYHRIDFRPKSQTEADFILDFVGECYIIPGVINATNVVLSEAVYLSSVPPVKNVGYSFGQGDTELYIDFDWPKKVKNTVVVYRMDDYPTGPDDAIAKKIECNSVQYDNNAGVVITNPLEGMLYSEIYSFFEGENGRVYSSGVQVIINNEPQRDVTCAFHYKKSGFFSKENTLTVEISSKGNFIFPKFVIESRYGGLPLKRADGDILAGIQEKTEISGSKTFKFALNQEIRKGSYLKLFFLNDQHYKKYRLRFEGNKI